jgi:hypothetical protein
MDDAALVGASERPADLREDRDGRSKRQLAVAAHAIVEIFPLEQLHDDEGTPFEHSVVEHLDNVRALHACRSGGLSGEPSFAVGVSHEVPREEFDDHFCLQACMLGDPDFAHASRP